MSAAEDFIKRKPLLAYLSLMCLILIVTIVMYALAQGNVSEQRFEYELKSKADTSYVKNAIEVHAETHDKIIIQKLDSMSVTQDNTLEEIRNLR
jgi:hypothetical protein